MKCTFRTRWDGNEIACACTLSHECIHAKECEILEFKLYVYGGIKECMGQRAYKREKGTIRQVRYE